MNSATVAKNTAISRHVIIRKFTTHPKKIFLSHFPPSPLKIRNL